MAQRNKKCGWHGCPTLVASWQWGCKLHFVRLPRDIKDKLVKIKPNWPEYKTVAKEATKYSQSQHPDFQRAPPCKTPDCKQLAFKQINSGLCYQCHCNLITGDNS